MSRQPLKKQAGQTQEEMTQQLIEARESSRLYKQSKQYPEIAQEVKNQQLTSAIEQQQRLLSKAAKRGRINLDDLDAVQTAVDEYLNSCKAANIAPSMLGFAPSAGHTRQNIYHYIATHSTESARFLDSLRSAWASIIQQMGLTRTFSEPVSIFLLKNAGQGMADKIDVSAMPIMPEEKQELSAEQIAERYLTDWHETDKDKETGVDAL